MRIFTLTMCLMLVVGLRAAAAQDQPDQDRARALAMLAEAEELARAQIKLKPESSASKEAEAILWLSFLQRLSWKDAQGAEALVPELDEKLHRPKGRRELALAFEKADRKADAKRIRESMAKELLELRVNSQREIYNETWQQMAIDCALAGDMEGFRRFAIEGRNAAYLSGTWLSTGIILARQNRPDLAGAHFKRAWESEVTLTYRNIGSILQNMLQQDEYQLIESIVADASNAVRFLACLMLAEVQNRNADATLANASFEKAMDALAAMCAQGTAHADLFEHARAARDLIRRTAAFDDVVTRKLKALQTQADASNDPAVAARSLAVGAHLCSGAAALALFDAALEKARDIRTARENGEAKIAVLKARTWYEHLIRNEPPLEARKEADEALAQDRQRRKEIMSVAPQIRADLSSPEVTEAFIDDARQGRWELIGLRLEYADKFDPKGMHMQAFQRAIIRLLEAGQSDLAVRLLQTAARVAPNANLSQYWMIALRVTGQRDDTELLNQVLGRLPLWTFSKEPARVLKDIHDLVRAGEYDKARARKGELNPATSESTLAAELAVAQALREEYDRARESAKVALAAEDKEAQRNGVLALGIIGLKQLHKDSRDELWTWAAEYGERSGSVTLFTYHDPQFMLTRLMRAELQAGNIDKALEAVNLMGDLERRPAFFRVLLHCVQSGDKVGVEKVERAMGNPLYTRLALKQLLSLVLAYEKAGDAERSRHVLGFVAIQASEEKTARALDPIAEAYARRTSVEASRLWTDRLSPLNQARALVGIARSLQNDPSANVKLDMSELHFN